MKQETDKLADIIDLGSYLEQRVEKVKKSSPEGSQGASIYPLKHTPREDGHGYSIIDFDEAS